MDRLLKDFTYFLLLTVMLLLGAGCGPQPSTRAQRSFHSDQDQETKPFFSGHRDFNQLTPYEIPPEVKERLEQQSPKNQSENTDQCSLEGSKAAFRVRNPKFTINVDTQVMDFQFDVESEKGSEAIRLKGTFLRDQSPWRSELYSVDQKVLEARRVQAVALCLTANVCDVLAVNIYYSINGKSYCRQLQSGVKQATLAGSGDEEELSPNSSLRQPMDLESSEESEEPVQAEPAPRPQDAQPSLGQREQISPAQPVKRPSRPAGVSRMPPPRLEDFSREQKRKAAIDYPTPVQIAPPQKSPYRIEGLPEPQPQPRTKVLKQAIGLHDSGSLVNATYVPLVGPGFVRAAFISNPQLTQDKDTSSAWGTLRTQEFIEALGLDLEKRIQDRLVVSSISRRQGGQRPGVAPGSHQTGLDIDFFYISKDEKNGLISAPSKRSYAGVAGRRLTAQTDVAKNWEAAKSVLRVRRDWTIVIFMDEAGVMKQSFCQLAKQNGESLQDPNSLAFQTLRSIVPWEGHNAHFHVRLYCPGNEGCGNRSVSLPSGTGCR